MSKAVITIHGFLTDTKDFGRLYEYLDFYDEVVACEVPGHNCDKPDFKKFTVDGTLVEITSCYDKLRKKHDEVDVIGFSMGGALASYLCFVRDVNKCVLLSPANKFLNPRFVLEYIKFYTSFRRKTYKSASGKRRERRITVRKEMKPHRRNLAVCLNLEFKRILPNLNGRTYRVFRKLVSIANKTINVKSSTSTPTLIIRGNLDELVPKSSVEYLNKHFTNCKTVAVEDVGHGMLYTNRDNVLIPMITEFLSDGEVIPEVPFREI